LMDKTGRADQDSYCAPCAKRTCGIVRKIICASSVRDQFSM
jgi:hypothetical protein